MDVLGKFLSDQLSVWPLAAANFRSLKSADSRMLEVGGLEAVIQHNPGRIASSTAETDQATLASRPCFLCPEHRPPEQFHIKFNGRKGRGYNIQVNPYPIFPGHLVIARDIHTPQSIWRVVTDAIDFARKYPGYIVYYNGPASGASAPDHMHFQACPQGSLPLITALDAFLDRPSEPLVSAQDACLYHFRGFTRGIYVMTADTSKSLAKMFYRLLDCVTVHPGETEPRVNVYVYCYGGGYRIAVALRDALRSHHYADEGPGHLTISPGAAEMAGVFIAPCREDYDKVTASMLEEMLSEVSVPEEEENAVDWRLTRTQRKVEVGIMAAEEIVFEIISDGAGPQKVSCRDGRIDYNGALYDELYFDSVTRSTLFAEPSFILHDVMIGIDFHWQRKRDQKFAGSLKFIVEGGKVRAINRIGMENYLLSVISSEMSPQSDVELLKAHAVISRSWLMTNLRRCHDSFDVCADDHCQRYQGLTDAPWPKAREAVDATWGQVLTCGGEICDARYSKCCGGRSELFSTCWEDRDYPCLQPVDDPWCDTSDMAVLKQVLNDYDLETMDFHDWTVRYGRKELSDLVARRTGIDFGEIISLEPLERGASGRIKSLRVTGTLRSGVIGKELAIRRALSESHLKSSAFEIAEDADGFILRGKGWGHGVGLCQIGAAVMASKGFGYEEILSYYYRNTTITILKDE